MIVFIFICHFVDANILAAVKVTKSLFDVLHLYILYCLWQNIVSRSLNNDFEFWWKGNDSELNKKN